jgi:hypothetical protein
MMTVTDRPGREIRKSRLHSICWATLLPRVPKKYNSALVHLLALAGSHYY